MLVGYRGVDGGTKLDCPEITRGLRHTRGDVLSVESRQRVAADATEGAARLSEEGAATGGYTVQTA